MYVNKSVCTIYNSSTTTSVLGLDRWCFLFQCVRLFSSSPSNVPSVYLPLVDGVPMHSWSRSTNESRLCRCRRCRCVVSIHFPNTETAVLPLSRRAVDDYAVVGFAPQLPATVAVRSPRIVGLGWLAVGSC